MPAFVSGHGGPANDHDHDHSRSSSPHQSPRPSSSRHSSRTYRPQRIAPAGLVLQPAAPAANERTRLLNHARTHSYASYASAASASSTSTLAPSPPGSSGPASPHTASPYGSHSSTTTGSRSHSHSRSASPAGSEDTVMSRKLGKNGVVRHSHRHSYDREHHAHHQHQHQPQYHQHQHQHQQQTAHHEHHRTAPLKDSMSRARLYIICAGIWASNFTFAFQSTAIPTLAPSISSSFNHAELAAYLGSVFTLGNTAGIPVYGVLIDTLGRRFAMLTACCFFGAGTVACALAPGMHSLIAARALSGLGGGGLLTVSAVICTDLVHLHERGFYQGIMMTIFGAGSMIGGPFSGWLSDTYGWRLSFWVQIPIIAWCAFIVACFLPEPPIAPTHQSAWAGLASLDWGGILLLLGSVSTLILGLSFHTSYFRAWSDPVVWGLLLASALSVAGFILVENKVKRPIVPLSMFRSRQLVAIWLSGTFLSIAAQAFLFHVPTYFAVLLDSSAAQAGLVVSICSGLGLSSGSLLAGYHIRRGGRYTWLGFFSLFPAIISSFVASQWTPNWPTWTYYATVLPTNIGYAIFLCVTLIALISSVDSHAMPKATALLYTVRSLGSTLGVSLGGSIQVGVLVQSLQRKFAHVPDGAAIVSAVVHSKAAIKALPPAQAAMALSAYARSLSAVWIAAGCVAVFTLVSALFIRQNEIPPHKGALKNGNGHGNGNGNGSGSGDDDVRKPVKSKRRVRMAVDVEQH